MTTRQHSTHTNTNTDTQTHTHQYRRSAGDVFIGDVAWSIAATVTDATPFTNNRSLCRMRTTPQLENPFPGRGIDLSAADIGRGQLSIQPGRGHRGH